MKSYTRTFPAWGFVSFKCRLSKQHYDVFFLLLLERESFVSSFKYKVYAALVGCFFIRKVENYLNYGFLFNCVYILTKLSIF